MSGARALRARTLWRADLVDCSWRTPEDDGAERDQHGPDELVDVYPVTPGKDDDHGVPASRVEPDDRCPEDDEGH